MSPLSPPDIDIRRQAEGDVADKVRELFDQDFAVIIMDSDFTTFDEVERACIALFGYTRPEAEALSMRVHTTGEALAAVMPEEEARQAVRALRRRNVLARVEKA
ncbi:MAG: ATP-dependent Clp protease adaptor ClpS [Actinomycetota bacterium]|jgi:ATP-dependent Clp protease adapter protein ClpS|nr:ATP-dependent Clp protease adaptor ClpS [Actinomycetota bacterium]